MPERPTIPIACALDATALPARLAAWQAAAGESVAQEPLDHGTRLRFAPTPGLPARLAELAEAELGCCGFFRFRLGLDADAVTLDITAPAEAGHMVDALLGR